MARIIYYRTPGGETRVKIEKDLPNKPRCPLCGRYLFGVIRGRPSFVRKFAKTEKRPERPYGGVLCPVCMRKVMKIKIRNPDKNIIIRQGYIELVDKKTGKREILTI